MTIFAKKKIQRWEKVIHQGEEILLRDGKGTTYLHNCLSKIKGSKIIITIRRATREDLRKEKAVQKRIEESGKRFIARIHRECRTRTHH
jgi:hypothetical protein